MPYGTVKEIKGKTVVVSLERQDMCGDCHACEMMSGKKSCTLNCETDQPYRIGDKVEVDITNQYFLKATYIVYGVPLVGFIIGLILGIGLSYFVNASYKDVVIAVVTLLGTALGVGYIKMRDHKNAYRKFLPHIVGKVEASENEIV